MGRVHGCRRPVCGALQAASAGDGGASTTRLPLPVSFLVHAAYFCARCVQDEIDAAVANLSSFGYASGRAMAQALNDSCWVRPAGVVPASSPTRLHHRHACVCVCVCLRVSACVCVCLCVCLFQQLQMWKAPASAIFLPAIKRMYPEGFTFVHVREPSPPHRSRLAVPPATHQQHTMPMCRTGRS